MAFTVTARHNANAGTTAAQTHSPSATTPTADSLLLLGFGAESAGSTVTPAIQTPTGGGLTYTLVAKAGESPTINWDSLPDYRIAGAMFRAPVGG